MTAEDIAISADNYPGNADEFVSTLVELRLLDGEPGAYRVHDWFEWQPWAAAHTRRKNAGRLNALAKWHKEGHHAYAPVSDCPLCHSHPNGSQSHSESVQTSANGNAQIRSDPFPSDQIRSDPEVGSLSAAPPGPVRTVDELATMVGRLGAGLRKRIAEKKLLPVPQSWPPEALEHARAAARAAEARGKPEVDVTAFAVGILINWRFIDGRPFPGSEHERARAEEQEKETSPPRSRRRKKAKRVEPPQQEDPPCTPEEAQRIRDQAKRELGIESG